MDTNISDYEYERAYQYCQKYLTDGWKRAFKSDINVSKLSGGLSNLLYRCALNDEFIKSNGKTEPKCVLLRLYGPTHRDTSMQIEIFRKLAEENLGPKLLADFEDGRLEEYLPSNPISWNDMIGDDASAVIARKFALIHKLQIDCLDKGSNWLLNMYQTYFDYFVEVRHNPPISKTCSDSTKQLILELMSKDFSQEIEYLSSLLQKSKEPLVFSHNDLHQNNIILLENLDNRLSLDERIVLIDFEYCSYNHRTFDIANHLSEWCFDYTGDEYPHFTASLDRFPSEEKQRQFVKNYLNELERDIATGKQVVYDDENVLNDKIETILREIQVSMMAANFLWTLWAIKSACTSKITFGYWEMAKWKWEIYLMCKNHYEYKLTKSGDNEVYNGKFHTSKM